MPHDHFCSPREVSDLLWRFCDGPVGLDPCTNERSIIRAVQTYAAGALHLPWKPPKNRNTNYENPPFSAPYLDLFLDHGIAQRKEHGFEHIRLVPVHTSTEWWRKAYGESPTPQGLYADRPSVMFATRLTFIGLDGLPEDHSARFDCAIFYYGHRHARFEEIFGGSSICNRFERSPLAMKSAATQVVSKPRLLSSGSFRRATDYEARRAFIQLAIKDGCQTVSQMLWTFSMPHRDRALVEGVLEQMRRDGELKLSQRKWQPTSARTPAAPAAPKPTNGHAAKRPSRSSRAWKNGAFV